MKVRRVRGKCGMHQLLYMAIVLVPAGEAVSVGDATQVFIDDGDRVEQGVEQDGVCCLLAHAGQGQ